MIFAYRRSATDAQVVEVDVQPLPGREGLYRVTVGERVFELTEQQVQHLAWHKEAGRITLQYAGREYHILDARQHRGGPPAGAGGAGDLRAPMAGKIIRVLVQPGEHVTAGTPLLILEAMKMEQQITAPQDGVVTRVLCRVGDQVTAGAELVVMEPVPTT